MTDSADGKSGLPDLELLYFYLTEGCNLACRHCWLAPARDTTGDQHPTLPVELFETAIREAKSIGLRGVKLTGGEPLLHPHFRTLLDIVQREELALTIETNGLLCTPEIASQIAACGSPLVSVSIDGVRASTHEQIRGVAGSFEAACQAVRYLAEAGLQPQVIFTVMRLNEGEVDDMLTMAEDLGAGSVKYNIVQPTARGEALHERQEALTVSEIIDLGRHVEQESASNTGLQVFFDYPQAFRSLKHIHSGDGCGVCGIHGILGVLASGKYALCGIGEQVPELVFGEVGKDALGDIWRDDPVIKSLREGLPERLAGVCSRCLMKYRCLGACVAMNYYNTGDLWGAYWFCAHAEEQGLFPTSRLTDS